MTAIKDGIWRDLETLILPTWRDGNRYPALMEDGKTPHPQAGELMDGGIGLEYHFKNDMHTKRAYCFIGNMHGGWSRIVLISIPHCNDIVGKIYGPAPSLVYVEEITVYEDKRIFTIPNVQLGRHRGIRGRMPFIASCNPRGPSHWVAQMCYDFDPESDEADRREPNPRYARHPWTIYHFRAEENLQNMPPGYYERMRSTWEDNPVELDRNVHGKWIEPPPEDGIFKDHFDEDRHVKGRGRTQRIIPLDSQPLVIGLDPGSKNNGISIMQELPMVDGSLWSIFDEMVHVQKLLSYPILVPALMDRLEYWLKRLSARLPMWFISDNSAFHHVRQAKGSYDAKDFQDEWELAYDAAPHLYPHLPAKIKIRPAPKGNESIQERVLMVINYLQRDRIVMSEACEWHVEMFKKLPRKDDMSLYQPPTRSKWKHVFDSMSYPMIMARLNGSFAIRPNAESRDSKIIAIGGNAR